MEEKLRKQKSTRQIFRLPTRTFSDAVMSWHFPHFFFFLPWHWENAVAHTCSMLCTYTLPSSPWCQGVPPHASSGIIEAQHSEEDGWHNKHRCTTERATKLQLSLATLQTYAVNVTSCIQHVKWWLSRGCNSILASQVISANWKNTFTQQSREGPQYHFVTKRKKYP